MWTLAEERTVSLSPCDFGCDKLSPVNVVKLLDNGAHAGCRNFMMAVFLNDLAATCARTLRRVRVASALLRQCGGKVYHGGQVDLSTSDRPEDAAD